MRASRLFIAALLCISLPPVQPARAVSFAVGYADSNAGDINSAFWPGANVTRARMCVSYNVAKKATTHPERVNFEHYLTYAGNRGVEVMVTLMNDVDNIWAVPNPTTTYDSAVAEFLGVWPLTAYPQLAIIGPWNEPNYTGKGRPTPANAALMYRVVRSRTDRLKIAGEWAGPNDSTSGRAALAADIQDYLYYLRDDRPEAFGYHAWTDIRKYQDSGDHNATQTRFFIDQISGSTWGYAHLWNTESGAFVSFKRSDGVWRDFTEAQQTDAMKFYFRTPNLSSRITRLYVYCFFDSSYAPGSHKADDSGVIRNNWSAPRSAYYSVRDRLQ